MPTTNSITLLNICRVIEQTPDEGLLAIDRDALAATTKALKALRQEVERTRNSQGAVFYWAAWEDCSAGAPRHELYRSQKACSTELCLVVSWQGRFVVCDDLGGLGDLRVTSF